MMKVNIVKIVKYVSLGFALASTLGTAWANDKETKATLKALVKEELQ